MTSLNTPSPAGPGAAEEFQVRIPLRTLPAQARLSVHGELDLATADQLGDAVRRATTDPCDQMVIDLSALTFCDARGLSALLGADQRMRAGGGSMLLTGASAVFRRLVGAARIGPALSLA